MYYFIANIKIVSEEEYQKYVADVDEVFEKFSGKYIVLDDTPKVLEGKWEYTRNVIITFETEEDFNDWYYSEDYQRILKHRLLGAECDTILVKGK